MRKLSKLRKKKIVPETEEPLFLPDPAPSGCLKSCCSGLSLIKEFCGCCLLPRFIFTEAKNRFGKKMERDIKSDSLSGMSIIKKSYDPNTKNKKRLMEGEGAFVVVDLEGSSEYWQGVEENYGEKETVIRMAYFMDCLNDELIYPLARKNNLKYGNTTGDGFLFFQEKEKKKNNQTEEQRKKEEEKENWRVARSSVLFAVEFIVRYHMHKGKFGGMQGPKSCRVGGSVGHTCLFFSPAHLNFAPAWPPSMVGLRVNDAFGVEQGNKAYATQLAILPELYENLKDDRLINLFEQKEMQLKSKKGPSRVYTSSLEKMQPLYEKWRSRKNL